MQRASHQGVRRWQGLLVEVLAFLAVGGVAYVVDVGLFNLLRSHPAGALASRPVTAKVVSSAVATLVSYAGNRWWTYRARPRPATRRGATREVVLFFAMNGLAALIAVACLAVSHYLLHLTSALADNVSANVVGVVLGTAFRFVAYRLWVFQRGGGAQAASQVSSSQLSKLVGATTASGEGSSTSPARSTP